MVHVPLPALITRIASESELHLFPNNQINIESQENNRIVTIDRSIPRWVGTFSIGGVSREEWAKTVEAWLSRFHGRRNTTDIPLKKPTIETATTISGSSVSSDVRSHTFASAAGLSVGAYFIADDKLYIITELTGARAVCEPQRQIPNGTAVTPALNFRVRLAQREHPDMVRVRNGWGPWAFDWVEA